MCDIAYFNANWDICTLANDTGVNTWVIDQGNAFPMLPISIQSPIHTAKRLSLAPQKIFYLHGRLGSVRQVIDSDANVRCLYTYEPYGRTLESDVDTTVNNRLMFTGQYYDSEIDQYYLRARQYCPAIARFTGYDPVLGSYEDPLTFHQYLYCLNDPVNKIDLTGEFFSFGGMMSSMSLQLNLKAIEYGPKIAAAGFAIQKLSASMWLAGVTLSIFESTGVLPDSGGVYESATNYAGMFFMAGLFMTQQGNMMSAKASSGVKPQIKSTGKLNMAEIPTNKQYVNRLASTFKNEGFNKGPISIVKYGGESYVVDGHHRLAAARQAGITEVPTIELTESELRELYGYDSILDVVKAHCDTFVGN